MTVQNSLVFWDNLKLLNHSDFSRQAALREKSRRESRSRISMPLELGYTKMPKTIDRLMKARRRLSARKKQALNRRLSCVLALGLTSDTPRRFLRQVAMPSPALRG
jgi:hypothetical protein